MSDDQKRILILEDSDIFADMLTSFLTSQNYEVQRAVNGFEGIKKVYSFMPHLVITDIEMPILKGYQATRLLKSRKNTKVIPVIMFTSLDETKDKFWGSQAGADAYIEKSPDNLELLRETIAGILPLSENIDFTAIEREGRKINDDSIMEIVNNLLDNKLFQTTIIGMLTDLSSKVHSMEITANGIFDLLNKVCKAEIITMMIRGTNRTLYIYTANYGEFTKEISTNFFEICISDFLKHFPDYKLSEKKTKNFHPTGTNSKKLMSYITLPLTIAGKNFASIHIANTINEYFIPSIMENINVFTGAASPVIANALSMHEIAELQKNTRIAFARYVPVDVMDEIINETVNKGRNSESRNVSVLFSDIRNFTAISEHSIAQEVVDFLNAFFSKMGNEIMSEGGHIDKFIGDEIMAVFGAFASMENSPENAIYAAIKMLAALDKMNSSGSKISHNNIDIGIGINYGECILGNIGFQNKMDYTVIGDTVNLASRIESLTKQYRRPLIITEYVYETTKDKFIHRQIDNVRVKGKVKPVGIYTVYTGFSGAEESHVPRKNANLPSVPSLLINRETLDNYNKGLRTFYLREWKLAQEYFEKAIETNNNDFLSRLYLERSIGFERNPPPENWDGVVTLEEK
ncbi:MAG: adenylate/guanylate cyclase domain-containing response regulator [Treponema sp.]|nr:adenylate/guanylate cyclase domain-containing response regulator [Treponema sp.]